MTGEDVAPPPPPSRRRPWLRICLGALAAMVVLLVGGGAILVWRLNPDTFKPRIIEAVRQATGRDISLNGPIGVKLSLLPTVQATDLALANPPGFSRPAMATLSQAEVQLNLLSLLRGAIIIDRVTLIRPDVLLEVNDKGERNWNFTRATPPEEPAPPPGGGSAGQPRASHGRMAVHVGAVAIQDGKVAYRNAVTGRTATLTLPELTMSATDAAAPIRLAGRAAVNGTPLTIAATTGSLDALRDENPPHPWPVNATLTAGAATMKIDGALSHPLDGVGYSLSISADIPDLPALSPLAFGTELPPIRNIALTAKLAEGKGPLPTVSDLTLRIGGADLTRWAGGLLIDRMELNAPAMDKPVSVDLTGTWDKTPIAAAGTFDHPAGIRLGGRPWNLDLHLQTADSKATVKGSIADPLTQTGVALDIAGQVPDLAALSPLARRPLPALRSIAIQAHMTDGKGGLTHGIALTSLRLTSPAGDLAGSARYADGVPLDIAADLTSNRLDADALIAAVKAMPTAPPAPPASRPNTTAPPGTATPAPPAPKPAANGLLFPNTPLPFGLLQRADADIRLQVATLRLNGTDTRSLRARLAVKDGRLKLDPFSADTPTGKVTAALTADATVPAPPVTLTLHAPGLALRPLLTTLGVPPFASGRLEVYADLHGTGETPHAIAASLSGHLGLAMDGGTLDTKLIGGQLGRVSSDFQILDLMGRGGGNGEIRCVAARFNASNGIAHTRTLVLSSNLLTADGGGTINLRDETMDLLLRPQGRMGGTGFRIPLRVSGPLRAPKAAVDASRAAEANAAGLAGIIIGKSIPETSLGGLMGSDTLPLVNGSPCPAALAVARGSTPPAAQPAAPTPAIPALPKQLDPGHLFRQLFR